MASIFDYQFNVGGNFTAAMDGMAESTGRFAAAVETSTQGLSKWEQKLAAFGLIGDYVDRACNAVNGIVEVGANAELQLMNLKTLFGGNAEAAKEMYERISEYGKVTPYDKAGLIEAQRTMMSFGIEGNPAHTGEIFTDNCAYVKSCNRKKKNLVQRYAGDKFLRRETQQSLREVQGESVSIKKLDENIDVLFDSKTTSHLSNDVAQSSQFLWNEVMDRMPQILSKSKLVAHEPNTKLDKKPWAVEYYYYEYSIQNHTLYFCIEYNNIVDENRQFYRLYSITSKLRESATRY